MRAGLVHYHFGSIDELRREACLGALLELLEPFLALAEDQPPAALVRVAIDASMDEYAPGTDEATLIYEVLPAAARDPALADGLRAILERSRAVLARSIRRWHPEPAAPPEVLAELVFAAIDGLQLHLLADRDLDFARHLDPLLTLLGPEHTP